MKTKKIFVVLAFLFLFSTIMSQNFHVLALDEFTYSNEIVPGKSFQWQVKTLDIVGDFYEVSTDFYIGTNQIKESDTITLKVIADPDETNETWYELLLNNNQASASDLWGLGFIWTYYAYDYGSDIPLVYPVTYTNATDSYNIYDLIWDQVEGNGENSTNNYTSTYPSSTVISEGTISQDFDLSGDIFTDYLYVNYYDHTEQTDGTLTIDILEATVYTKTNKMTGLLEEAYSFISWDEKEYVNSTLTNDDVGHSNFWLKLTAGRVLPYSWAFSILGLSFFAIVFIIRRKR